MEDVKVPSETSKHRDTLEPYCTGAGLDIGYGGDPIVPWAICHDLPRPYTRVGLAAQQLAGDCRRLEWFRDGVLNFVYSSHLIEDFSYPDQRAIVAEWLRVIKAGGHLVILAPDQRAYIADCHRRGRIGNTCHIEADMSLAAFRARVISGQQVATETIHQAAHAGVYSWELVLRRSTSPI